MKTLEPEKYNRVRNFLRVMGLITALAGLILMGIGLVSFFLAFGGGGPPRYFWCAMVGLPVLAVGGMLLQLGFSGAVLRYLASQSAPVARDTANYMAEETKDAVKTAAKAAGQGLAEGIDEARRSKNPPPEA